MVQVAYVSLALVVRDLTMCARAGDANTFFCELETRVGLPFGRVGLSIPLFFFLFPHILCFTSLSFPSILHFMEGPLNSAPEQRCRPTDRPPN